MNLKLKKLPLTRVDDSTYLYHEDIEGQQVVCKRCGLEDYIENLVISVEQKQKLIDE